MITSQIYPCLFRLIGSPPCTNLGSVDPTQVTPDTTFVSTLVDYCFLQRQTSATPTRTYRRGPTFRGQHLALPGYSGWVFHRMPCSFHIRDSGTQNKNRIILPHFRVLLLFRPSNVSGERNRKSGSGNLLSQPPPCL